MNIKFFKPSKGLIKIIIPNIKDEFIEFYKQVTKENNPIKEIIKDVNKFKLPIEKVQKKIKEDINDSITYLWKRGKKGEKIKIIYNQEFSPEFLAELKRHVGYANFSHEFYKKLPKEMLDYYSKNKVEDERFDISVSKKNLCLKVKNEREILDIKNIKMSNKWKIT